MLQPGELTRNGRLAVLVAAFLGWMLTGLPMALMNLAARPATAEFLQSGVLRQEDGWNWARLGMTATPAKSGLQGPELDQALKVQGPLWFSWYNAAFLLGAATGGLLFGWVGDHFGRVRAMVLSICCYSLVSGLGFWVITPEQLLVIRFVAALGTGGIWPNGVALASEAWADASRPTLSGLIGASVNVGIMLMGVIGIFYAITPQTWRWLNLICAVPALLAIWVRWCVPESPSWLQTRGNTSTRSSVSLSEVFRPPLLKRTLLGICLGTIPLLGGWGVTAWVIPWTDKAFGGVAPKAAPLTSIMRSAGGAVGSLLGGWLANQMGRRTTYFLVSLLSLACAEFIFLTLTPKEPNLFQPAVFALGFISTIFFGWLPLYLPELFPTHARARGAGVSFNFGRILTAVGVLGTGALTAYFHEDYARAGSMMGLIYGLGMIIILFAPDTSKKSLKQET